MGIKIGDHCNRNEQCAQLHDANTKTPAFCNSFKACSFGHLGAKCNANTYDCGGRFSPRKCIKGICSNPKGTCSSANDCIDYKRCINSKCVEKSDVNGPCHTNSDCKNSMPKLKCVQSKCTAIQTKQPGEACADDFECQFHCTKDKVCYGNASNGCTEDFQCAGKGGYCCLRNNQCVGPNQCTL
jgi:hypothetical protein